MNKPELIIISKASIDDKIHQYINNLGNANYFANINCRIFNNVIKEVYKEIKLSISETYIFLGQHPNAFLYGLYKSDNNIYIVKSFMDTVMCVVPFNKKYFE